MASTAQNSYVLIAKKRVSIYFKVEGLSDSNSASYAAQSLLGRSAPLQGYEGSGPRTISFTAIFYIDENVGYKDGQAIKDQVHLLQSALYPDYSKRVDPPPRCIVSIENQIKMTGLMISCAADYPDNFPWDMTALLIHGVRVSMTFIEIADTPISSTEVQKGLHQR